MSTTPLGLIPKDFLSSPSIITVFKIGSSRFQARFIVKEYDRISSICIS